MTSLAEASQMMAEPDLWGMGLKTFAMLCIVLATLILAVFLAKRFSRLKGDSGGEFIRILSSHYVAPKQRIALVDIVGEKIVIGITSDKINFLTKIEGPEAVERIDRTMTCSETHSAFSKFLKSSLKDKGE